MAAVIPEMAGGFATDSLYVGDLDPNVNDGFLRRLFGSYAPVNSVHICKDQPHRESFLCHAFVNFRNYQDAATAMKHLYFTKINGKHVRIMFSHRIPWYLKRNANVFVKNLDSSIDNEILYRNFAAFGPILSCKVAIDATGQSKGHGFVQFEKVESAQRAIKNLNGLPINGKQMYVGPFIRQQERIQAKRCSNFTSVFVKNLPETTTDDDLKQLFGTYGAIISATVMKDANGKSRCFGFVNFQSSDSAAAAVEKMNGTTVGNDKTLYVGLARSPAERVAEFLAKTTQKSTYEKPEGNHLFVKNFDESYDDEKLKELFSKFGTITSCKVERHVNGLSKGYGIVSFSTVEEATRAMKEMNGKMIGQKSLHVGLAHPKEDRMDELQRLFGPIREPARYELPNFNLGTSSTFVPPPHAGFGFQPTVPTVLAVKSPRMHRPFSPPGANSTFAASNTQNADLLQLILGKYATEVHAAPKQAQEVRTVSGDGSIGSSQSD